jgi:hypothetical protein
MFPADFSDLTGPAPAAPPELYALRGHLQAVSDDLERLTALLGEAATQLLTSFSAAHARLDSKPDYPFSGHELARSLRADLDGAMTALQFQDLASQLVDHSVQRIRAVADYLDGSPTESDRALVGAMALARNSPVGTHGLTPGPIELF